MKWATMMLAALLVVLGLAVPAWAQSDETRPAVTTFWGDTGLWFVPSAEVLPAKEFSFSLHRNEFDYRQGNTNVSFWPITAAVGAGPFEFFGAARMITSIDRDTSPLLFTGADQETGGLVNTYPTVRESWTGNDLGDIYVGAKVNLLSQRKQAPMALAVRGTVKTPVANRTSGAGTGAYDWFADLIASKEFSGLELSSYGGVALRGDPDNISISDGFRWGVGAGFPTRTALRFTAEVYGESMFDSSVNAPAGFIVGDDGSLSPAITQLEDEVNTTFGLTWISRTGMSLGAGVSYRFGLESDNAAGIPGAAQGGDAWGMQFRLGFTRAVKPPAPAVIARAPETPPPAPPAPAPAPPPPPPAPTNSNPRITAMCDPCTIEQGKSVKLRVNVTDPDGDPTTVRWTTTGGTIADTRGKDTTWKAESIPGTINFTVTADDGRGGLATTNVSVNVTARPVTDFGDILFDFDSAVLRPNSLTALDTAANTLMQNPSAKAIIEGHTSNEGETDYNSDLGGRRAQAVKTYLVEKGVAADRLSTVSLGESRPAHDNVQEATRHLNRRAVIVVKVSEPENR